MWTYERIKAEAQNGRKNGLEHTTVKDLLVLAPQNDPFYVGTTTDIQNAEWFADLWSRFGYHQGVHLRRIHYQIVSQDPPVQMPNGKPYENTDKCWNFLACAAKSARYLELVDPASFDDRRAREPIVNYQPEGDSVGIDVEYPSLEFGFKLPDFPDLPEYSLSMNADQAYQVEIWTEKSTMNDVLLPLCKKYQVNLVAGVGEMSVTQSVLLIKRLAETQKPCRILYVSDFDPAGLSMPVAAARKTEFFVRNQELDLDIELQPVVLTHDQCVKYRLPRTPIKETERRAGKFEERWGEGATELDALESLHPGELRRILEKHILRFHDEDLGYKVLERKEQVWELLDDVRDAVLDYHRDQYYSLRNEYQSLRDEFQNRQIALDVIEQCGCRPGTALVVSDRVAHCQALAELIQDSGLKVRVLTGQCKQQEREEIVRQVQGGKVDVLISTVQLLGEGFDCSGLSSLFLATPTKFRGRLLQVVGRILRPGDGKSPVVYDYVDQEQPVLLAQAKSRQRALAEVVA